jgi:hypothetical protein
MYTAEIHRKNVFLVGRCPPPPGQRGPVLKHNGKSGTAYVTEAYYNKHPSVYGGECTFVFTTSTCPQTIQCTCVFTTSTCPQTIQCTFVFTISTCPQTIQRVSVLFHGSSV